jgi:hypothetical protein
MDANEKIYSTEQAAALVGVKKRAIQTRCKNEKILKISNQYVITDSLIAEWKRKENAKQTQRNNNNVDLLKLKIKTLEHELENYQIADNERIEVFTNEDYEIFQSRLLQWFQLQKDIKHQQEVFDATNKSNEELVLHYQNQFEYQKEQSTRILEMHEKLLDTIHLQASNTTQRNIIEAKDKDIIDKDWKTKP